MDTGDDQSKRSEHNEPHAVEVRPVKSLAAASWREGVLTRAMELQALSAWLVLDLEPDRARDLREAIAGHLDTARRAATEKPRWYRLSADRRLFERATSNLDAAEAQLLNFAPPSYLVGQMPSLLDKVQRHLDSHDPLRQEFERIAKRLGVGDLEDPLLGYAGKRRLREQEETVTQQRGRIVSAVRGADSEACRGQISVGNFRNIIVGTTLFITVLAAGIAVISLFSPTTISLCFQPENSGQTLVVCPTAQSTLIAATQQSPATPDVDDAIRKTVGREDVLIVEVIGLAAASLAAANTIRILRHSTDPWSLSVVLATLKLPTGALTAFLGILFLRGQFVPGLGALDTSGQILAWAAVFGYGQRLFTRFVDQQVYTVLDPVRDADKRN